MTDTIVCRFMRVQDIRRLIDSIDTPDATIEVEPMLGPMNLKTFQLGGQYSPITHSKLLEGIEDEDPNQDVLICTPAGQMGIVGFIKGVPLVLFVSPPLNQISSN